MGEVPLLNEVGQYISEQPGKQLRPKMVLLAAKACGHYKPQHMLLAAAVEMLHNASLLHDDVVDESDSRRGRDSIRHRWSNQVAVLCGDYYLAQVMGMLQKVNDNECTDIFNRTVATMCMGELIQLKNVDQGHPDLDTYLKVIGSKTASLMATCCELGARNLDTAQNPEQQWFRDFGYHYGLAFQIRDDLHDTEDLHEMGLPQGISPNDLIQEHIELAKQALSPLPDSDYKEQLISMLNPSDKQ